MAFLSINLLSAGNIQLNAEILDTTVTGYDVTVDIADSSGNGTSLTLTILFTGNFFCKIFLNFYIGR